MQSTFVLILLLSASALAVRHESMPSEHGSLYYYHKFAKDHTNPLNTHIPLQTHYSNERNNRKEAYKLDEQMSTVKRESGFKERDLKHKILKLENQSNVLQTNASADEKVAHQKEESIKEDLNHSEKFRELYEERGKTNAEHLTHALPDEQPALQKLVEFDHNRQQYWSHKENGQQKHLQKTVATDIKQASHNLQEQANVGAQIMALKADLSNVHKGSEFAVGKLEAKKHHIENVIEQDTALDQHRRENYQEEAKHAEGGLVHAHVDAKHELKNAVNHELKHEVNHEVEKAAHAEM